MNKYLKYFLDFVFGGVGLIVFFVVDGLFEGFGGLPLGNYLEDFLESNVYSIWILGIFYAFFIALLYKFLFKKNLISFILFFLGAYLLYVWLIFRAIRSIFFLL